MKEQEVFWIFKQKYIHVEIILSTRDINSLTKSKMEKAWLLTTAWHANQAARKKQCKK